jgi:hypothetical protein
MRRDEQEVRFVGPFFEDDPQPEGLKPRGSALAPARFEPVGRGTKPRRGHVDSTRRASKVPFWHRHGTSPIYCSQEKSAACSPLGGIDVPEFSLR